MRYNLSIDHVDTCFPDYVLDHCNGEGEALIGISVHCRSTVADVISELREEIIGLDCLPDDLGNDEIELAILAEFPHRPDTIWDSSLDEPDDAGIIKEYCQAWFRLSWENSDVL